MSLPSDTNVTIGVTPEQHQQSEGGHNSKSEQQQQQRQPPRFLNRFEALFSTKNFEGKVVKEATGWAMDSAAKGPTNVSATFLGTAILVLANAQAGCQGAGRKCPGKVYGVRPSSLLTLSSSLGMIISSLTIPFIGSLIDHSRHRKTIGGLTALIAVLISLATIFINENTWFPILILDTVGQFLMIVHYCTALAYLPEMSQDSNELATYTSRFNMYQFACTFIFVAIMTGVSMENSKDPIKVSRVSQGIVFGWGALMFGYAWIFLFSDRPPLKQLKDNDNLLTSGIRQIAQTTKKVFSRYSALKWFIVSLLWLPEQGSGTFLAFIVTFMYAQLGFPINHVSAVVLIILFMSVVGSSVSRLFTRKFNALRSLQAGILVLGISVGAQALTLTGPDRKYWQYFFAMPLGLGFGWIFPSQRVLMCTLTPRGQEAEIMGLLIFFGNILGWIPPLVFSAINEAGYNMSWALGSFCIFFVLALFFTFFIGSYDEAVKQVLDLNSTENQHDTEEIELGSSIPENKDDIVQS